MKQTVLDVLVYLFQNYMSDEGESQADRESVQSELLEAGFAFSEVDKALEWLDELAAHPESNPGFQAEAERSFRVYAPDELLKLDAEAVGFLMDLERSGILSADTRELIMDRVMALETEEIDLEELKWVILMVLFNQPGQEEAYAWMEDLVFDGYGVYLH
jgi:Smg protein